MKKLLVLMGVFCGIVNWSAVAMADTRCNVECNSENIGKYIYCDKNFYSCNNDTWTKQNPTNLSKCEYKTPQEVVDDLSLIALERQVSNAFYSKGGAITNGSVVDLTKICAACPQGVYYEVRAGYCIYNANQAWCSWRGEKEQMNTSWHADTNTCECTDEDKDWNVEKHTCVSNVVPKKCNVECNMGNNGKTIFCENKIYGCNATTDGASWDELACPNADCEYTAPNARNVGEFTKEFLRSGGGLFMEYAKESVVNGGDVTCDDICTGCVAAAFSDGDGHCYDISDHAWCEWEKRGGADVEWQGDKCVCIETGNEWNKETHACDGDIEPIQSGDDGVFGGKCGVTCDASNNQGKHIYCENAIYVCKENGFEEYDTKLLAKCKYIDPETKDDADANKTHVYKPLLVENWSIWSSTELQDGGFVDLAGLCYGCSDGRFKTGTGSCISDEQDAWCNWRLVKDNFNVEWNDAEKLCICTDFDKKWDATTHDCVEDADAIEQAKKAKERAEQQQKVANALTKIKRFTDAADANLTVWRDTEGKFNTTRLASDATAGVVLGTVGGIVTGKVIKKKQLEKGFEVLHCEIGGQKMADYGDTFRVEFQR